LPAARVRFVDISNLSPLETATETELSTLFRSPFPKRPVVVKARFDGPARSVIELRVPPDLSCLRGHFRDLPVVPGAIQLGWVLEFSSYYLKTRPCFRLLKSVKFQRLIQPGQCLRLTIALDNGPGTLRFEYVSDRGTHASGHIVIGGRDG
jgi:3-hydroxymyristoyl/3-hydroxydecanoyl-(acyl carrier protein) dehydratase